MLNVTNGIIGITRGDTAHLEVSLTTESGEAYTMQEGDTLTLTVRQLAEQSSQVLLQSVSTTNTITLTAEQTAELPVGQLSYDVQLITFAGEIYTVAGVETTKPAWKNFIVWGEVTT